MRNFETRLIRYMDAGFPLLYVDTFEEEKAVESIKKTARGLGLLEWNIRGFFDYDNHASMTGQSLADTLELLLSDDSNLNRKALVLLGAHFFLDDPAVIERLKQIAQKINTNKVTRQCISLTSSNHII